MKYKIGEFSNIYKVTVKTLRYYEELGLMIPEQTDPFMGYRYYSSAQFERMSKIMEYCRLGFSLGEIHRLQRRRRGAARSAKAARGAHAAPRARR